MQSEIVLCELQDGWRILPLIEALVSVTACEG